MGIKLDWEIEAEQSVVQGSGEDKEAKRRRRMAQLRLLLGVVILIGLFASVYGFFVWRLRIVDNEIQRALTDTVQAEVTTLRVSDRNAFLDIQRSASETWAQAQLAEFDEYQALKVNYDVQLTGNVVDVVVDGSRGRVQVEEIIDGIPYVQTWFYWRYAEDGWRHVPPDYTFWGDQQTIDRGRVLVRYNGVDAPVAERMADEMEQWLNFACSTLDCTGMPPIAVTIVPIEGFQLQWSDTNSWLLEVPSPFVGRARYDRPFDSALQQAVAEAIATRLVEQSTGALQPSPITEADYLKQAAEAWLVGEFTSFDTGSYLFRSFAARYGEAAPGSVIGALDVNASLQTLANVAGVASPAQLEVDWRDYLLWRLELEDELRKQGNEGTFVSQYDTRDPQITTLAFNRFQQPITDMTYEVASVQLDSGVDGLPLLRALVRTSETEQTVGYRLVDGTWKRIN
ncbi:MAG: hypothetical protein AAFV33_09410 [Chloroflexota bacterium]